MSKKAFMQTAKVMSKGQVTIPKPIREILGVKPGDHIAFIVEGDSVRIANSAIYTMQIFQKDMEGEAEQAGLTSEEAIMDLIREIRYEEEKEN